MEWRKEAERLGVSVIGVARVDDDGAGLDWPAAARLRTFVEAGRHGDMAWMAAQMPRRSHPRALWPQARSAIMAGLSYGPARDPLDQLAHRGHAAISVYAQGKDYHDVFKAKLKHIARAVAHHTGADVKVFVDTAPLMEKPLAELAGLGWQGKHTNLVSRSHGSWLFLGAILTDAALEPDEPERDHCGSCRACLDVCPTDAFPAPYQLDARRCLAYLSIEHKGPIPHEFRAPMGNRVFGCDDCLAVCPWNKFAQTSREAALWPRPQADLPALVDLARLDEPSFRAVFAGSPIKRTGRDRFVRNVTIALGNCGDPGVLDEVERLLDDHSALVRGAAVWAAWRLAPPEVFEGLRAARRAREADAEVVAEWDWAERQPAHGR